MDERKNVADDCFEGSSIRTFKQTSEKEYTMTAPGDDGADEERTGSSEAGTSESDQDATPLPGPPRRGTDRSEASREEDTEDDDSWWLFTRDVLMSVLAVALIGGYLFAMSGVWPPMVAIESESMEPNMNVNDLVFVMDADRFQPSDAHGDTGIVTAQTGSQTGYEKYGDGGDVIIFAPDGNENDTPIIHRAMFWVEEGENWVDRADDDYLGSSDSCDDIRTCPAPNDGFITKGDNNNRYDQVAHTQGNSPVKSEWVVGTAEVRIPGLGWLRLQFQ